MLNGITLAKLSHVLQICGLSSRIRYCEDENIEEQFREDVKEQKNFIIVNYWRQFEVKDKNYIHRSGHFSLVAGFNQMTDELIILDTNQTRFPHHWIKLKHLLKMMCTLDRMDAMPRGYRIVTDPEEKKEINHDKLK